MHEAKTTAGRASGHDPAAGDEQGRSLNLGGGNSGIASQMNFTERTS
jgi:hypothetical protein